MTCEMPSPYGVHPKSGQIGVPKRLISKIFSEHVRPQLRRRFLSLRWPPRAKKFPEVTYPSRHSPGRNWPKKLRCPAPDEERAPHDAEGQECSLARTVQHQSREAAPPVLR